MNIAYEGSAAIVYEDGGKHYWKCKRCGHQTEQFDATLDGSLEDFRAHVGNGEPEHD